jgi:hypothetical protein
MGQRHLKTKHYSDILRMNVFIPVYKFFRVTKTHYLTLQDSYSWEARGHSASYEIPSLLWDPRFITVFTKARIRFLCLASLNQSTPSYFFKPFLILFSHLQVCPKWSLQVFRLESCIHFWPSHACYMPRPCRIFEGIPAHRKQICIRDTAWLQYHRPQRSTRCTGRIFIARSQFSKLSYSNRWYFIVKHTHSLLII